MSKVQYKPEFWELINYLTKISNEILIQKIDNNANIISLSTSVMGAFITMDSDMFDYNDKIIINDFGMFNKCIKAMGEYTLDISDNKMITMDNGKIKTQYLSGAEESLPEGLMGPVEFDYGEPGAQFMITEKDLKDIKNLIGLLIAKSISTSAYAAKAVVTVDGELITVDFMNTGGTLDGNHSGNSFKMSFKNIIENTNDGAYTYEVSPSFFEFLPPNSDFVMSLKPKGHSMTILRAATTFTDNDDVRLGDGVFLVGVFRD